MQNEVNYMSRV